MKGLVHHIEAVTAFQIDKHISLSLGMREPTAAFLVGRNKQALKHHGSSRKAAAEAGPHIFYCEGDTEEAESAPSV